MSLEPKKDFSRDSRYLLTAACLVIVIAGLKASAAFVVPVLAAALLALACIPPMNFLRRLRVPDSLAVVLVMLGVLLGIGALSVVVGNSIGEFSNSVEIYSGRLSTLTDDWFGAEAAAAGEPSPDFMARAMAWLELPEDYDFSRAFSFAAQLTGSLLDTLSNMIVVLLILVFMLFEVNSIPAKFRRALGSDDADLGEYQKIADQIYGYMSIKAVMSFVTGVLVTALTWSFDSEYSALWGLMAFLFNFVPNVGSIIAAVPAVLLCLIQPVPEDGGLMSGGPVSAALLAGGYAIINIVIGNILEPRVMGKRLGLSPLVVILSLLFWSWVWGPVGMVLSLPLTMIVKIVLEHSTEFRAVAVLLGPAIPPDET